MTLINSQFPTTPTPQTTFLLKGWRKSCVSKCSNNGCVWRKDRIYVMSVVILPNAPMLHFGGLFGKASLGQHDSWYYETYSIKAVGFTWWNLPVINSLARVQRVNEAMSVTCVSEENFLCTCWFSSELWDCEFYAINSNLNLSVNYPADDHMWCTEK